MDKKKREKMKKIGIKKKSIKNNEQNATSKNKKQKLK